MKLKGQKLKSKFEKIYHIWDYIAEYLAELQTVKYIQKRWNEKNDEYDDEKRTKLIQFIACGLYNQTDLINLFEHLYTDEDLCMIYNQESQSGNYIWKCHS